MTVKFITSINRWIGLSGDTKPTVAPPGSTFFETDTGIPKITIDDGTTWVTNLIGGQLWQ